MAIQLIRGSLSYSDRHPSTSSERRKHFFEKKKKMFVLDGYFIIISMTIESTHRDVTIIHPGSKLWRICHLARHLDAYTHNSMSSLETTDVHMEAKHI